MNSSQKHDATLFQNIDRQSERHNIILRQSMLKADRTFRNLFCFIHMAQPAQ